MVTLHPFCPYLLIEAAALSAPEVAEDLQGAGLFWRTCSAKPPKSSSEIKLHKTTGGKRTLKNGTDQKNGATLLKTTILSLYCIKKHKPVFTKNLALGENAAILI